MKIKITTQDVIDTTRYMTDAIEDPTEIIKGICNSHRLTSDFVREFSAHITPEMFMTSYRLSKEMADRHPNLFSDSEFRELLKYKEDEVELSEEDAQQQKVAKMFTAMNTKDSLAQIINLLSMGGDEEEKTTRTVVTNNLPNISISMLAEYYSDFKDDTSYRLTHELIKDIIRDSTDDELNNADVLSLMGIEPEIDELLLKRIKDEDVKNSLLLAISVSDEHSMTSSTYKHLTNDFKEDLLGTENVAAKDFINALSESKDLGWKKKMIERAISGEIEIETSREVMDKELLLLVANLPEDMIAEFTKLSEKLPNAFSYKLMSWLLDNKDFNEDQLIEMKDVFKKAGLFFNLRKLAQANGYNKLKDSLMK